MAEVDKVERPFWDIGKQQLVSEKLYLLDAPRLIRESIAVHISSIVRCSNRWLTDILTFQVLDYDVGWMGSTSYNQIRSDIEQFDLLWGELEFENLAILLGRLAADSI